MPKIVISLYSGILIKPLLKLFLSFSLNVKKKTNPLSNSFEMRYVTRSIFCFQFCDMS